jgi:hypothetical protein
MTMGYMPAANAAANRFSALGVDIYGWDSTVGNLTARQQGGTVSSSTDYVISHGIGVYFGSNTWNSLTLFPASGSFVNGTEVVLEGWD